MSIVSNPAGNYVAVSSNPPHMPPKYQACPIGSKGNSYEFFLIEIRWGWWIFFERDEQSLQHNIQIYEATTWSYSTGGLGNWSNVSCCIRTKPLTLGLPFLWLLFMYWSPPPLTLFTSRINLFLNFKNFQKVSILTRKLASCVHSDWSDLTKTFLRTVHRHLNTAVCRKNEENYIKGKSYIYLKKT